MAGNPRIDDLRKRIERDPQSRLFAQLAEELRKDGDLEEAIQVARDGLSRHPQYPSARLTLGRALMDTGDTRSATRELEAAVKGAPDNLLASRLLAECLEAEGQLDAALERYKATLPLAAGDRQLTARIDALEDRMRKASAPGKGEAGPAPISVLDTDEPMELESTYERAAGVVARSSGDDVFEATPVDELPPIPLVETSEEFELERPYDALAARAPVPMPVLAPEDIEAARVPEPAPGGVSAASLAAPAAAAGSISEPEFYEAEPLPEPEILEAEPETEADLNSSTLAELYFNQGFTDQAIDVYRQILDREPANERVQARLRELEALQRHLQSEVAAPASAPTPGSTGDPRAARRASLQRTIARLEGLQASFRKG